MIGRSSLTLTLCLLVLAPSACKGGGNTTQAAASPAPAAAPAKAPGGPGGALDIDVTTPLPEPLPDIVAVVNGKSIPIRNVKLLAENALKSGQVPADQKAFAYRKALQQFIVRELLFQEAVARGLAADQKRLDEAENQARAGASNEAWKSQLATQGLDEETFKAELRIQHTVNALIHNVQGAVGAESVPDAEVKKFYDENRDRFTARDRVRASHIFIRVPADVAPERKNLFRTKAEGLLAEIRGGADFAALARKHSEDPASKGKGGEMEAFARGQLPHELGAVEQAIYSLKPGEVSDVVESSAGFHIAKLLERLPDETVELEPVKEQVRAHLLQQKRNDAMQALVNNLRAKAKIETRL